MLVFRAEFHIMPIRLANREDTDQNASPQATSEEAV